MLNEIVCRFHQIKAVIIDEIVLPLFAAHSGEKGSVGAHHHYVGVSFEPREERRFRERGIIVIPENLGVPRLVGGVFSEEYAVTASRIVVVQPRVLYRPLRGAVEVVVHDGVGVLPVEIGAGVLVILMLVAVEARAPHYLYFRIFILDRLCHYIEVLVIKLPEILVAYAYHLEVERRGVTGIGAQLRPLARRGIAVGVLDKVEYVLLAPLEFGVALRHRFHTPALTGKSRVKYRQRLRSEVFAQQEIFVETYLVALYVSAVALSFSPKIELRLPSFHRSHRKFPVVGIVERAALHKAAAGETHELRLELAQRLHEVLAQPAARPFGVALAPILGSAEIPFGQVKGSVTLEAGDESSYTRFKRAARSGDLRPLRARRSYPYLRFRGERFARSALDVTAKRSREIRVADKDGDVVARALRDSHSGLTGISAEISSFLLRAVAAVITFVAKEGFPGDAYFHIERVLGGYRRVGRAVKLARSRHLPVLQRFGALHACAITPSRVKYLRIEIGKIFLEIRSRSRERLVYYLIVIHAAVYRKVDILEENSVKTGAYRFFCVEIGFNQHTVTLLFTRNARH